MNIDEIAYASEAVSGLMGLPVRVYMGRELYYHFSPVELAVDPMEACAEDLMSIHDEAGTFTTKSFSHYGVVNSGKIRLIVGSFWDVRPPESVIRELAISIGIDPHGFRDYADALRSIANPPLNLALQMLCLLDFMLNGTFLSLTDIAIHAEDQGTLTQELTQEEFSRNEQRELGSALGNSRAVEREIAALIKSGSKEGLMRYLERIPSFRQGVLSPNRLRSEKNAFITTAAIESRAAADGGMEFDEAMAISDSYVNRCETLTTIDGIRELSYHMALDYAERVGRLRIGSEPRKNALKVASYVQSHLYEPIKTSDIARALYMDRSALSYAFKKETGINLSDYVQQQKIAEAKRLLANTEQTILSISTYLGFSSQSHFSAVFKRICGMTPREYRCS